MCLQQINLIKGLKTGKNKGFAPKGATQYISAIPLFHSDIRKVNGQEEK
jgi:hypothetical protein